MGRSVAAGNRAVERRDPLSVGGDIVVGKMEPSVREFNVVIERDSEGYFVASVPSLAGCHTQARSLDELMSRIREAVELCLEVEGEEAEALEFVGVQRLSLAG